MREALLGLGQGLLIRVPNEIDELIRHDDVARAVLDLNVSDALLCEEADRPFAQEVKTALHDGEIRFVRGEPFADEAVGRGLRNREAAFLHRDTGKIINRDAAFLDEVGLCLGVHAKDRHLAVFRELGGDGLGKFFNAAQMRHV